MKLTKILSSFLIALLFSCSGNVKENPEKWSEEQLNQWFSTGEWRKNWQALPDESIDKKEFAKQYFAKRELWDKAFEYLNTADLDTLKPGNFDLIGKDLYIAASEYNTKNDEEGKYEAHRKYADIQYVISGQEKIRIIPLDKTEELGSYDEQKDIVFLKAEGGKVQMATPEKFFIFFSTDAHMPGMKVDTNSFVKKIVVKVKLD